MHSRSNDQKQFPILREIDSAKKSPSVTLFLATSKHELVQDCTQQTYFNEVNEHEN